MTKRNFANRFGLVALMALSLFASTAAFAGAGTQQVVVTNTPAQSIPIVGLVKDLDGPGHIPFRTALIEFNVPASNGVVDGSASKLLTVVPSGLRLVIEHVSGRCLASPGFVALEAMPSGSNTISASEYLPGDMFAKIISSPVKFYAEAGESVYINATNSALETGICYITVTGDYIGLAGF